MDQYNEELQKYMEDGGIVSAKTRMFNTPQNQTGALGASSNIRIRRKGVKTHEELEREKVEKERSD